jgi:methyltransferase
MIAGAAGLVMLLVMLGELRQSRVNESALRARGASEPAVDVYRVMAWVYPLIFVAMACEGIVRGPQSGRGIVAGLLILVLAKLLKFWAIATLGARWTFRVLIVREPLVAAGPYAFVRHPNYIAVIGEIVGFALLVDAPFTGVLSFVVFGELLRRRIAVEERALGL